MLARETEHVPHPETMQARHLSRNLMRMGQPEDVARLVVFLAAMPASGSPDRRFTHGARD